MNFSRQCSASGVNKLVIQMLLKFLHPQKFSFVLIHQSINSEKCCFGKIGIVAICVAIYYLEHNAETLVDFDVICCSFMAIQIHVVVIKARRLQMYKGSVNSISHLQKRLLSHSAFLNEIVFGHPSRHYPY